MRSIISTEVSILLACLDRPRDRHGSGLRRRLVERGRGPGEPGRGLPFTIEHRYGRAVMDCAPQRVVGASFNDADYALALGVVPVGVRDFIGPIPEERRSWGQPAFELLLGLTLVAVLSVGRSARDRGRAWRGERHALVRIPLLTV